MNETSFSEFIAMRSVGQFLAFENSGPLPYMWNISGLLGVLQSKVHWHLFDLCRFHQVMYNDLNRQVHNLDRQYEHYKKLQNEQELQVSHGDYEDHEWLCYQNSQINDSFIEKESEIERIKNFADEFSVIGLWASAEQFLGKIYAHIEHHQKGISIDNVRRPHRWEDFVKQFEAKSIILSNLNGYADANECRVLNNTIKHTGFVDNRLAQFSYFTPHLGVPLTRVNFQMQRYLNGIFNFLGSLIEAGNLLLDPSFIYWVGELDSET